MALRCLGGRKIRVHNAILKILIKYRLLLSAGFRGELLVSINHPIPPGLAWNRMLLCSQVSFRKYKSGRVSESDE